MVNKKDFLGRAIQCPRCWVPAKREKRRGIEIDICSQCKGIWLDTRELKKLLKNKDLHEHLTKYIGIEAKSDLVCPRCGSLMNLERAKDVEVDVCLQCRGIWLDPGELESVAGMKGESFETYDFEKEVRLAEVQKKKRRSILDKLVDFFHYK